MKTHVHHIGPGIIAARWQDVAGAGVYLRIELFRLFIGAAEVRNPPRRDGPNYLHSAVDGPVVQYRCWRPTAPQIEGELGSQTREQAGDQRPDQHLVFPQGRLDLAAMCPAWNMDQIMQLHHEELHQEQDSEERLHQVPSNERLQQSGRWRATLMNPYLV